MTQDQAALRFYRSHRSALVEYARGITGSHASAEDVVQEAWLHLDRKVDGTSIREPLAYFYRTVRNLAIDGLRRKAREVRDCGENIGIAVNVVPDDAPSAERTLLAQEDLRRVFDALEKLPQRQRDAIEMYRFGGLKMREIAFKLGISIPMVHHLIAQGLAACDRSRAGE